MVQHLTISGKKYVSSAELASSFGYTSDYISRLAREEKIIGTCINRKWFIDEESLTEFVHMSNVQKVNRGTELKIKRQEERLLRSKMVQQVESEKLPHVHVALAQSLAVFLCVACTGLLGWTMSVGDIGMQDLTFGMQESYGQIADAIVPDINPLDIFAVWSVATVSQRSVIQQESSSEVKIIGESVSDAFAENERVDVYDNHLIQFSDEVDITFEDDGYGVVRPVFKNQQDAQEYRMLLAPTNMGG